MCVVMIFQNFILKMEKIMMTSSSSSFKQALEIAFDQLMKIHDQLMLCDHHMEELNLILSRLNDFYKSIKFNNDEHEISSSETEFSDYEID